VSGTFLTWGFFSGGSSLDTFDPGIPGSCRISASGRSGSLLRDARLS
jgi:hypothetical protein